MPRGFPGPTVKTPAKTPTARRGKTSSATPTPDNQPLQPSDGWATKSLQKPKPRGKGRPFQPGNPYGRPKGSKNKVKPLEKPKRKATGKPFEPGNCNGGRPKGSKNKFSRDLKEAYLLARPGGVGWLPQKASAAGEPVALYDRSVQAAADDAGGKSGRAAHRRARLLHSGGGLKPMCLACSSISHVVQ